VPVTKDLQSKHFTLQALADGVYACIHKEGGAAYSNAGIIDLGDWTIVVDAFDSLVAGSDLRKVAESIFDRPVDTILLTHCHIDHWVGASAFEPSATLLTTSAIRRETLKWGKQMLKDFQDRSGWEKNLEEMENKIQVETDERVRAGLEKSILRT
jgi:cyclase